jgi:hypothetical protein
MRNKLNTIQRASWPQPVCHTLIVCPGFLGGWRKAVIAEALRALVHSVGWLNQGGPEIENGEAVAAILEPMRPWLGEQGRSCLSPKAQRDWSPVPKFDVAVAIAIADLRERENTAGATMR